MCHFHFFWQRPINALINFYDFIVSCQLYYQGACQPAKEREQECIDYMYYCWCEDSNGSD